MDEGNGKSQRFQPFPNPCLPVVQKAACGDLDFCDLSPPVSPRREMVSQYTLWNTTDQNRQRAKY